MNELIWKCTGDGVYGLYERIAQVKREDPDRGTGHFALWTIDVRGQTYPHAPTLRDAKKIAERFAAPERPAQTEEERDG